MSKDIYMWWLISVKDASKNQVVFDGVCNICWLLKNNMFQNKTVSMFNSKLKSKKNYLKNMFDLFLDKSKYKIISKTINVNNWKEAIINDYIKIDDNFNSPYVELLIVDADKTNYVKIAQENINNEIKYKWKKIIYVIWYWVENWIIKRKPIDVIINSNIIPNDYDNLQNWNKINDELVIVTEWDIIIWPNTSYYNWILMNKKNLLITPSNQPFRLYWWLVTEWKILNYKRQNSFNINFQNFSKNYNTLDKNFALTRLKYPVSLLIDKRFINSKLYSYIYKIFSN